MSSQISLRSPCRLIRNTTFGIFCKKEASWQRKPSLRGKNPVLGERTQSQGKEPSLRGKCSPLWLIWDDTLRTCIQHCFYRARLVCTCFIISACLAACASSCSCILLLAASRANSRADASSGSENTGSVEPKIRLILMQVLKMSFLAQANQE